MLQLTKDPSSHAVEKKSRGYDRTIAVPMNTAGLSFSLSKSGISNYLN